MRLTRIRWTFALTVVLVGLLASASTVLIGSAPTVLIGSAPTVLAAQDQEPELAPERPAAQIVFAIADGDGAQPSETQIAELLASLGPVVTVALTELSESQVIAADVIVISPATSSSDLKPFLLKTNVPIVAMKPANWNALGLVPPLDDGTTPLQSVGRLSIEASHPIAADAGPALELFADGAFHSVGQGWALADQPLGDDAPTTVATGGGGAALIAFDAGDRLGWAYRDPTDRAAACRVAFPGSGDPAAQFSDSGLELLAASVSWATGPDCETARLVPATPSLDASMCRTEAADEDPDLSALWVRALVPATIDDATVVFVGGRFSQAFDADAARDETGALTGGAARMGVFGCDLDAGAVTSLEVPIELGEAETDGVRALAFDGTWLYVGGRFTVVGDDDVAHLVRVDPRSGELDTTWRPELRGSVSALAIDGNMLYAGGGIRRAGDLPVTRLVRFDIGPDATGSADPDFTPLIEATVPVEDDEPFASVLALEVVGDTLYFGGSFQSVDGQPRNSIAAISITTAQLGDFAPSIGDNNFGVDPIPQVKDVVADGRGNVFLCGDWWLVAEEPGQTWFSYDIDNGADDPNVLPDGETAGWIGQRSRVQPRPNQFNVGKFDGLTGASAVNESGIPWGPVTDGGVQACDYDPISDTLILGGHYERIGTYDQAFIDAGGPVDEDDYPVGHQPYEKLTAIDGATGKIFDWDPDVDSIRGLDAVRILHAVDGRRPQILVGGAITESDRTPRESLARYAWRS